MDALSFNRNNLDRASSPYLRQHAGNPVWWQEWKPEVLRHAEECGKPLFVSIGYATCHWCHVMAAEAFSDPAAAGYLNGHFVAIKVDRQERPDIDRFAMDFLVRNYGQGGWPLNIFLASAARPFAAATYLPLESVWGRPAFIDYLRQVSAFYREHGDEVPVHEPGWGRTEEAAGKAAEAPDVLQESAILRAGGRGSLPGDLWIASRLEAYRTSSDTEWGGFGATPKFPPHSALIFLLYAAAAAESAERAGFRALVEPTLDFMRSGGLHDHLQGGFFRYCTDRSWTIPHFEKMLYDQAQLLWTYALAARLFGRSDYEETARGVLRCLRENFAEDGFFIAGLDADTEHREGATYLWSLEEVRSLVGLSEAERLSALFELSEKGNFEGLNHLVMKRRRPGSTAGRAAAEGEGGERAAAYREPALPEETRELLLAARRRRKQPARDGLVVSAWNALAGIALVQAWRLLGDRDALTEAVRLFGRILERHYFGGRLVRSSFGGVGNGTGYLEDAAALLLFATFLHEEDRSRLDIMAELGELVRSFRTPAGWLEARNGDFPAMPAADFDSPLPSSVSLAEAALVRADLVVSGVSRPCPPGDALHGDFRSWAALHASGALPLVGAPDPLPWDSVPPGAIQYPAEAASICRMGICEPIGRRPPIRRR